MSDSDRRRVRWPPPRELLGRTRRRGPAASRARPPRRAGPGQTGDRVTGKVGGWLAGTGKWVLGVVAAALVTALGAVLAGWLQVLPGIGAARENPGPAVAAPATPSQTPEAAAPEAPVTFAVRENQDHCRTNWLVPGSQDDIDFSAPPPPSPDDPNPDYSWPTYPASEGGFPASPSEVYITIQGRSEVAVVLTRLQIVVTGRQPAPRGTTLDDPCGGPGQYRWLNVDLDRDPPQIARVLDENMLDFWEGQQEILPEDREPIQFPYTVSAADPETFLITATTVDCRCDWVAVFDWQSAGRTGSVTVDHDGQPFRTAGTAQAPITCDSAGICRDH